VGGGYNIGTVFSLDPATHAETVLYEFSPFSGDGEVPTGGLVDVNGILYGTTYSGGSGFDGTVFSFDPSTDIETVLHSFGGSDGAGPYATLIEVNGTFYGTTVEGGFSNDSICPSGGCGTVFALDPRTGSETVLYSFCGQPNCADGATPYAGLIYLNGTLYGTTYSGGNTNCRYGCGTVYAVNPTTGAETMMHAFKNNAKDGANPYAGLIDVNGTLYGTTYAGGTYGNGTVFSFDPDTGAEKMLHVFGSKDDGRNPQAGLIKVRGTLYGTTENGGSHGYGTVVSLDLKTGTETVLYSFCSSTDCADGFYPEASLLKFTGRLYGTTVTGGAYHQGVVFRLKLP
jgi:uncharacterized repeat protein (TIGR03803 family)